MRSISSLTILFALARSPPFTLSRQTRERLEAGIAKKRCYTKNGPIQMAALIAPARSKNLAGQPWDKPGHDGGGRGCVSRQGDGSRLDDSLIFGLS